MAQVQRQAAPAQRSVPFAAALATYLVAIAILVSGAIVAFMQSDFAPRTTAAAPVVTDGWLPAVTAANAARRAAAVTDGWSSRYLVGAAAGEAITDGWSSRYLVGAAATDRITDGWATRYLGTTPAAEQVVDGWAIRYLDGSN